MPARKKKSGSKSGHYQLYHPKYHHHVHFATLIIGIIIFLILIAAVSQISTMKNDLTQTGAKPTCLSLDGAVMNKNGVDYLSFDANISIPYPDGTQTECRLRYKYPNDQNSQFGSLSYSHPEDQTDQSCIGEFPLAKPKATAKTVEVELVPFNNTRQIEGNNCTTTINLPK